MSQVSMKARIIIWPSGGGDIADQFDSDIPSEIEPDTLLNFFEQRLGETSTDIAYTTLPDLGRVSIGWVFPVPPSFSVPGPREGFEVVAIPMVVSPEADGGMESLFVRQERELRMFEALSEDRTFDELTTVNLDQRSPMNPPQIVPTEPDPPPDIPRELT